MKIWIIYGMSSSKCAAILDMTWWNGSLHHPLFHLSATDVRSSSVPLWWRHVEAGNTQKRWIREASVWENLHPGRLTWNTIIGVWFRSFSFLFMGDGCRFQPLIFQGVRTWWFFSDWKKKWLNTLPETNMFPVKLGCAKRKFIFQALGFQGLLLLVSGTILG